MVSLKRTAALLLALGLSACLTGCTVPPQEGSVPSELPTVLTTVPEKTCMETTAPEAPFLETTAPTQETTIPHPDPLPEPEDDDFVRIVDYVPNVRQALSYATEENFTGQVIYEFQDAYLRYGTVKKLAAVAAELEEQGLGLLIWDGYRPVYAQAKLYEVCPDPTFVSPPGVGNQNHCRGRAVDLTLYDLTTGEPVKMPTGFDDFSDYADRDYSDVSEEVAANARILEEVMQRNGFNGYSAEWCTTMMRTITPLRRNLTPRTPDF